MKRFKAVLYKDIKLFFKGTWAAALFLPLLLFVSLNIGLEDLNAQSYLRPFPIAVRDLDETVLSRSLISQLRDISLFSQVSILEDDEWEMGENAAVITIPKDFFYEVYAMRECPVEVVLNDAMKLESTAVSDIIGSAMEMIRARQAVGRGVYRLRYGQLTPSVRSVMIRETSGALLEDALGRQGVFGDENGLVSLRSVLMRRLTAAVFAMLALFFALSAARTLPEEAELGMLARFRAVGGSLGAALLSKLLAATVMLLPAGALGLYFTGLGGAPTLLVGLLLLCFGSFGLMLAVVVLSETQAAAQVAGNMTMLLSLTLGGVLWPARMLPWPLAALSRLTPAYYASLTAEAAMYGCGIGETLSLLWPLAVMGALGFAAAAAVLEKRGRARGASPSVADEPRTPSRLSGVFGRLTGLTVSKLKAMSGGWRGLALLTAVSLICGFAAAGLGSWTPRLSLAVLDLDGGELSRRLADGLKTAGLDLEPVSPVSAKRALITGGAEGLLTIPSGYGQALADGVPALSYAAAAAASSAQGVREIIAGQAVAQRCKLQAPELARELLGRPLSESELDRLDSLIDAEEQNAPSLYSLTSSDGEPPSDPFVPGPLSLAALAVLLGLVTFAPWSLSADGRRVLRRLRSFPLGGLLYHASDLLALFLLGLLIFLAAFLPSGPPTAAEMATAAAYSLCSAALAMALAGARGAEGQVDALAPFLSLVLCLFGGCFADLSSLSPAMERLSLLTAPGLLLRPGTGSALALTLIAAALLALGAPLRRK